MAIRVEHQPSAGAVGMAAYATGMGRRQQRQQKYSLALYEGKRREQQRIMALRAGGRMRGGGGGGQPQGQWSDPLADNPDMDPKHRAALKGQRRARDRHMRMGKGVPEYAQPTFTSQDDLDRARDEAREDDLAGIEREEEIENRGAEQQFKIDTEERKRRYDKREQRLETSGHTAEQQRDIHKKNADLAALKRSERLSPEDEEQRQAEIARLEGEIDDLWDDPQGDLPLTPQEQADANIIELPGGGFGQWNAKTGKIEDLPKQEPDTSAADAAEKMEEFQQKKEDLQDQIGQASAAMDDMQNKEGQTEYIKMLKTRLREMKPPAAPAPEQKQPGLGEQQTQQITDRQKQGVAQIAESGPTDAELAGGGAQQQPGAPAGPKVREAQEAARNGDVTAQRALARKGLSW